MCFGNILVVCATLLKILQAEGTGSPHRMDGASHTWKHSQYCYQVGFSYPMKTILPSSNRLLFCFFLELSQPLVFPERVDLQ
jgi:hypothetical protein